MKRTLEILLVVLALVGGDPTHVSAQGLLPPPQRRSAKN